MAHVSLEDILEWEKQEDRYTFDVLTKEYFDVELKRYPPGGEGPDTDHTHEMDELYYVISGAGTVTVGEETYTVKAGEMVFVDRGVAHEFHATGEEIVVLKILAGPGRESRRP